MKSAHTKLCCVIGNPVEHSLSPQMHNAAYKALGLDFTYLAFAPTDLEAALKGLLSIGTTGISVTIPFKEEILKYVGEIDQAVEIIGSANTLLNKNSTWYAHNSDWIGAIAAIKEKTELKERQAIVLGSGGVARAIAYGLKKEGALVYVVARNNVKGPKLVRDLSLAGYFEKNDDLLKRSDIIINATPLGMKPNESQSPVEKNLLTKHHIVFDCVYTPKKTKLLEDALDVRASVVYGYKMLLYQGVEQFKLFTGHKAPIEIMEKALVSALSINN